MQFNGWLFLAALCASGCTAPAPEDDPQVEASGFEADTATTGARLWIEVAGSGSSREVSLWAANLGGVLGIAAHVVLDPSYFTVGDAQLEQGALADAVTVLHEVGPGDLTLGLARRGAEAGDMPIDTPTRIARIRTYFHTPEAVTELCRELDLPCRTSGYRFW